MVGTPAVRSRPPAQTESSDSRSMQPTGSDERGGVNVIETLEARSFCLLNDRTRLLAAGVA